MSATPFTVTSSAYGTFSSTYEWYVQWYQYPTNTSTFSSDLSVTVNSFYVRGNDLTVNLTVTNTDTITRSGTSGYTAPDFTYETTPKILLINDSLGESINLYEGTISAVVAAASSGSTAGSIIHTHTATLSLPITWLENGNRTWRVNVINIVNITNTSVTSSYIGNASVEVELPIFYEIRFNSNGFTGDAVPNEVTVGAIYGGSTVGSIDALKTSSFYGSIPNTAASLSSSYTFSHETLSYLDYVSDAYETIDGRIVRVFTYATRNTNKSFPITWKDNNNKYGRRPSKVIINIYTNGILAKSGYVSVSGNTVTDSVPTTDYLGNTITYTCTYEAENYSSEGTVLRGLVTPYYGTERLTSFLIGSAEQKVYLGELLFNFDKIKWLLTESGAVNPTVSYVWDDTATWDDSMYWTEN